MFLQNAAIHDHKNARIARLGRSWFINDILLQP